MFVYFSLMLFTLSLNRLRGYYIDSHSVSVLANRLEYDDPAKWRKGTVQALKFLRDPEKTLVTQY